mmetsp:Transcript_15739/g.35879  ORF Transcript_15739/g.35879 Transcript_15739/m.35879 type:complete len:314 (+) Transcript_15739:3-944(+)
MLSPDGYYTYLNIPKARINDTDIDLDVVKRNYRKLSIRHHPDKPGGDVDTFRTLKRAQTVLSDSKLRQQYDILGIDLDDDESEEQNHSDGSDDKDGAAEPQTTSQTIVQDIASAALTTVLQLGVRTVILAVISVFVARYRLTLAPALAFMAYVAYTVRVESNETSIVTMSPLVISIGVLIMYQASSGSWSAVSEDGVQSNHWLLYWLGESITIFAFTFNSVEEKPTFAEPLYLGGLVVFGILSALWFRGKFWNYAIVIGLEIFFSIFIAVSFPVFEMILEAILNDKLKKVGEKIRAQHKVMERYYQQRGGATD